jgi:stage II sporulation protein R
MKKIFIIIGILITLFLLIKNEKDLMIPEESIRFRVIANSNEKKDIEVKEYLANELINKDIFNRTSIEDSRNSIINNIDNVKEVVSNTFKKLNYNKEFDINYGVNYFPEKVYRGVKYNSGYYESLVITIGEGKGNNYWCVIFPPLCMIDEENLDNVEYKFKIVELIEKYIIKK